LSPKTDGNVHKAQSLLDGKQTYTDQKTEKGYQGGESTTDAVSQD